MLVAGGVSVSEKRSEEFRPTRTEWAFFLCAEHVYQPGGASPLHNVMDVK